MIKANISIHPHWRCEGCNSIYTYIVYAYVQSTGISGLSRASIQLSKGILAETSHRPGISNARRNFRSLARHSHPVISVFYILLKYENDGGYTVSQRIHPHITILYHRHYLFSFDRHVTCT